MNVVLKKSHDEEYGELLAKYCPRVIQSERQYKRVRKQARELIFLGSAINPAQVEIAKLLGILIQIYEREHYHVDTSKVTPLRKLKHLMESNGHRAKDLWDVIGDKGTVSKILSGERQISKAHAQRLAAFYHVTPALFI